VAAVGREPVDKHSIQRYTSTLPWTQVEGKELEEERVGVLCVRRPCQFKLLPIFKTSIHMLFERPTAMVPLCCLRNYMNVRSYFRKFSAILTHHSHAN